MNASSWIVLLILGCAVALIVRSLIRSAKSGDPCGTCGNACGGSCGHCNSATCPVGQMADDLLQAHEAQKGRLRSSQAFSPPPSAPPGNRDARG